MCSQENIARSNDQYVDVPSSANKWRERLLSPTAEAEYRYISTWISSKKDISSTRFHHSLPSPWDSSRSSSFSLVHRRSSARSSSTTPRTVSVWKCMTVSIIRPPCSVVDPRHPSHCIVTTTRPSAMLVALVTRFALFDPVTSPSTQCCTDGDRRSTRQKSMRVTFGSRSMPTNISANVPIRSRSARTVSISYRWAPVSATLWTPNSPAAALRSWCMWVISCVTRRWSVTSVCCAWTGEISVMVCSSACRAWTKRTVTSWNSTNAKTTNIGAWTVCAFRMSTFSMVSTTAWTCRMRRSHSSMQSAQCSRQVSSVTIACVLRISGHVVMVNVY